MYPNWLIKRASLSGERVGLSFDDQTWTFTELNDIAFNYAGKLASFGIRSDSRVAFLSKSHPEFVFMLYGCLHLGCEIVLLNERLTERELAYQIEDSGSNFIVADETLAHKAGQEKVILFEKVRQAAAVKVELAAEWKTDRTISIMYTSGTTGFPKGVRQTAENHFSSAVSSSLNIGLSPDDVWLCVMPLFHISGFSILMRSLIYGMGVRLHPKFDEKMAAKELADGRVTHMSVVGIMLERLLFVLETENLKVSPQFKAMLAGGGPIAGSYIERAASYGISVLQTYGMTETSSQTTTLAPEDAARKQGSSGKPLFLYDIKLGDDDEVLIKGPHVTPGYIGRFSAVQPTENGYLKTGDIGRIDEEGFLYILDRRSDLIVSGGENVYPAEIENVLMSHPEVREAGVCGMADSRWGEVPAAFVVARNTTGAALQEYCKERLASYKVPKKIIFTTELPRNASNKLLRRELKKWI